MAELGFVLAVAVLNGVAAVFLARGDAPRSAPEWTRPGLGAAALALGWLILRFGGVLSPGLRARGLLAIGAIVFGLGCALISAAARERALEGGTLRASASSTIVPLAIAGGASAILMMMALRATAAVPLMLFAFALGATLGTLLSSRAGDPFPLVATATATITTACAVVATRNVVVLRAVGFHSTTLTALGPLLPLLAAMALAIGTLAVHTDEGETDAPVLRGFVVATAVGTLAVVAASHWWARPPGRGGWLALPALGAAFGSAIVLLLGRYYDDPSHRAGRAIARARRGGPKTRLRVGARIGAEGALVVIVVAALVSAAAYRAADILSLEGAGALGIAIAVAASLTSFAFLDAVAAGREARTLAHDVLLVSLCCVAMTGETLVALAAVPIALALVAAGIVERVAAANEDSDDLRRRAAMLPVVASGILAAAATLGALLPS